MSIMSRIAINEAFVRITVLNIILFCTSLSKPNAWWFKYKNHGICDQLAYKNLSLCNYNPREPRPGFPKVGDFSKGGRLKNFGRKRKKVLGVFISNFKTYTRYSWVADEHQKKRS